MKNIILQKDGLITVRSSTQKDTSDKENLSCEYEKDCYATQATLAKHTNSFVTCASLQ